MFPGILNLYSSIEWQVFCDNTEKSQKLKIKRKTWKMAENRILDTEKKKYERISLLSEYFKVKCIIKVLLNS